HDRDVARGAFRTERPGRKVPAVVAALQPAMASSLRNRAALASGRQVMSWSVPQRFATASELRPGAKIDSVGRAIAMPPREALAPAQAGGNPMADGEKLLGRFDADDGVGVIPIDNPPVNALGPGVRDGIVEALEKGEIDAGVKAMVIIGAGRGFIAGADIRQFGKPRAMPKRPVNE